MEHNSTGDTKVNLRRIQLIAINLSPAAINEHDCQQNVCYRYRKIFKQKQHVVHHQKTVHADVHKVECGIGHAKFDRRDNCERRLNAHETNIYHKK